jgi:hypothetical protein
MDQDMKTGMSKTFFYSKVQTSSEFHVVSCSLGARVISQVSSSWAMKLTAHLYLVLMFRMSVTIPLLCLYAFMEWVGTTFCITSYFYFFFCLVRITVSRCV